uniref:Uncharacterized protein n=1 Tax=Rhizophora mucronata TaxID=61149 RepID=A0A2P2QWT8_RHIMU
MEFKLETLSLGDIFYILTSQV